MPKSAKSGRENDPGTPGDPPGPPGAPLGGRPVRVPSSLPDRPPAVGTHRPPNPIIGERMEGPPGRSKCRKSETPNKPTKKLHLQPPFVHQTPLWPRGLNRPPTWNPHRSPRDPCLYMGGLEDTELRPEDPGLRPEGTDGWTPGGRRSFLVVKVDVGAAFFSVM